ncbi:hypothetical protein RM555_25350 [Micromonospora sp. DSM 115977]|uniref:Uncharacterized protein n=1 Tax=Micromonospora reichwaldensis TaxID=3075516 RepID=A0ABU2X2B7_9ACTN|nr:hypothetical protein [Micromonospora sp. DSM 115977]MDT0532332.1 hypothetical protein [Micromonospora sp. DSM 115977]
MSLEPPTEPTVPALRYAVPAENATAAPADHGATGATRSGPGTASTRSAGQGKHSLADHIVEAIVPGTREQRWSTKTKALIGALVAMLLVGTAGCLGDVVTGILTADRRVAAEEGARQQNDQRKKPFAAAVRYDDGPAPFFRVILDRPLTEGEQEVLQSTPPEDLWDFMRPLGARRVWYPSTGSSHMPGDYGSFAQDATVFTMNIVSDRTAQTTIVGMRAVNVECRASTARTVVDFAPDGASDYEGVTFDLASNDPVPYMSDDDEPEKYGRPYFSERKIDLGGGMSPGGLRVEALVEDESCAWEIEATYHDSTEGGGGALILNDNGKPFFAEARPRNPAQYWMYISEPLPTQPFPCHKMPTVSSCAHRH